MATHDLRFWQHHHDFGAASERRAERRTLWVVGLTFIIAAPLALGIAPRMEAWRELRSRRRTEEPRI